MVVEDRTPHDEDATDALEAHTPAAATPDTQVDPAQEVMALLSQHVPLTLLADLASPEGPHSDELVTEEGLPEVAWWEPEEHSESV